MAVRHRRRQFLHFGKSRQVDRRPLSENPNAATDEITLNFDTDYSGAI